MKIKLDLLLFLIVKLVAMIMAWYFVGENTKLGDTQDYINGVYVSRNDVTSTAYLMSVSGLAFKTLFGSSFFANLPLNILSFVTILYAIGKLQLTKHKRWLLLLLLMAPSFTLWTSIHSKEAIISSSFCMFVGLIIKGCSYSGLNIVEKILLVIFVGIIGFFKPVFIPALIWVWFFALGLNSSRHRKSKSFFVVILCIALTYLLTFHYFSIFDLLASTAHLNFSITGTFTRDWAVWSDFNDMVGNLFPGILISFIGPTFSESLRMPFLIPFFIEGLTTFCIFLYLLYCSSFRRERVNIYKLFMLGGFFVLLLVAHYPFGYFNPGSAMRYRQGFYPGLLILLWFYVYDLRQKKYVQQNI